MVACMEDTRTDADLLNAVAHGDRDAFAELYRLYESPAFGLALRITCDRALAEEALQEAMLLVWQSAATWRKQGTVRSWLMTIVARESLGTLRSRRRLKVLRERVAAQPEPIQHKAVSAAPADGEMLGKLRDLLQKLPEAERQLLALYYGGEMSQNEIAKQLDLPQTTISFRIKKSLESLRHGLAGAGVAALALEAAPLREALCGGAAAPNLLRNVLPRLGERAGLATSSHGTSYLPAVSATVLMLAGVFWLLAPAAPPPVVSKPRTQPLQATVTTMASEPEKRMPHLRFTFDNGLPAAIQLLHGTFEAKKSFGAFKGVVQFTENPVALLKLPFEAGAQPWFARVRYCGYGKPPTFRMDCSIFTTSGGCLPAREFWHMEVQRIAGRPATVTYYWLGEYHFIKSDEGYTHVSRFLEPPHTDHLYLRMQNVAVDELEIGPLDAADIPEELRDPKAALKRYGIMLNERNPRQKFMDLRFGPGAE